MKDNKLSAGICDNCDKVKDFNAGGNGIDEPTMIEPMCMAKMIIIEPLPIEHRLKKCEFYKEIKVK